MSIIHFFVQFQFYIFFIYKWNEKRKREKKRSMITRRGKKRVISENKIQEGDNFL